MTSHPPSAALLLALTLALAPAAPAAAGCTTTKDASAVGKSIRLAVRCNDRLLRSGSATCTLSPPPACAGSLVTDAVAVAYGANNPPAAPVDHRLLRDALSCQRRIGRAAARFVGSKLAYLVRGLTREEAEAKSRRLLDQLADKCLATIAKDVSGVVLPDVGPQCDAAVGGPGTTVAGGPLRDCLLTLLETWVDRVGPNPQPPRPNIVLILTDDQRFDTIGPLHSVSGTVPVMPTVSSQILGAGVTFANSFVTTALCCPSRSSLLASKYSHTTGVHDNGGTDGGEGVFHSQDSLTLPVWLQAAGYRTGLFGKYLNGYAAVSPYVPPGWNEFHAFRAPAYTNFKLAENGTEVTYNQGQYSTDVLRDKVVQFIHDSAGVSPFFVEFTPYAPHAPATPAPRHVGMFSGVPPWRPPNYAEPDASDKPAWVQGLTWDTRDCSQCPSGTVCNACDTDTFRQKQLECLQAVDEAVAAILQALEDEGVLDDTMIVFNADNGFSWGSHRWRPKQCPYEECMRVPLAVRYKPLAPLPRTEKGSALQIDLAVTFTELAGATPDPGVEGRSLVRLLDGTDPAWPTDILNEHWNGVIPTNGVVRGSFNGGTWKYVEYVTGETELYDLEADPYELTNVASDPGNATLKTTMATRLRELYPGWPPPTLAAPRLTPGPNYDNDDEFE